MFYFIIWPLIPQCDLDHRHPNFSRDTPPHFGEYLSQVILKSLHAFGSKALDTGFALTLMYDLDIWMADLGLVCYTPSRHGEHLYQNYFEIH
jgi:hypothetical protein